METIELTVDGMSCAHCVAAVKAALSGVDGAKVESVEIGRARIDVASAGAVDDAIVAVRDAGYDARVAERA